MNDQQKLRLELDAARLVIAEARKRVAGYIPDLLDYYDLTVQAAAQSESPSVPTWHADQRYIHQPAFHALVDGLVQLLLDGVWSPDELREAVLVASVRAGIGGSLPVRITGGFRGLLQRLDEDADRAGKQAILALDKPSTL